jgi:FixJ family two-component response regulator
MTEKTYLLRANKDRRVFILHPDQHTCEVVGTTLRIEGYEVATTLSWEAFNSEVCLRLPDVAILGAVAAEQLSSYHRALRELKRHIPVILIQEMPNVESAVDGMRRGAVDVLAKPIHGERLIAGVKRALGDGTATEDVVRTPVAGFARLSTREREVLELLLDGRSNKETASAMGLSPRTIEYHRANIIKKLGARNAIDLARLAML